MVSEHNSHIKEPNYDIEELRKENAELRTQHRRRVGHTGNNGGAEDPPNPWTLSWIDSLVGLMMVVAIGGAAWLIIATVFHLPLIASHTAGAINAINMNHYILGIALACAAMATVGLLSILKNATDKLHWQFGIYFLSIALWSFTVAVSPHTPQFASWLDFLWSRTLHVGCIFIPVLFFHFAVTFANARAQGKWLPFAYGIAVLFNLLNIFTTTFTRETAYRVQYSYPRPVAPLYLFYVAFFFVLVIATLVILWNARRQCSSQRATVLLLFLIASAMGYFGGVDNFLIMIDVRLFPLYPYGGYLIFLYAVTAGVLIFRRRLLDV